MVTTFNENDMREFGEFIAGQIKEGAIAPTQKGNIEVTHADFIKWKTEKDLYKRVVDPNTAKLNTELDTILSSVASQNAPEPCISVGDIPRLVERLSTFITSITDPENQPNQYGIEGFGRIMILNHPKDFESAVRPLIGYMAENHHPHTKAIVESNTAELVEGLQSVVTDEYLVD
jgi:hypothetical protein